MNELFQQYSGAMLVAVSFFLILILLFSKWGGEGENLSFLEAAGLNISVMLDDKNEGYENDADAKKFEAHATRNKPTIIAKCHAVQRIPIQLSDLFEIKDCDERIWNSATGAFVGSDTKSGLVRPISLVGPDGVDVLSTVYDSRTSTFMFTSPDTYELEIRIMDYDNVEVTYLLPVAVDLNVQ